METTLATQLTAVSVGLLLLRLVVGLAMAAHGSQKLFGWFSGHGLAGTGGFFEMIGFKPGRLFAMLAGATEVVSGFEPSRAVRSDNAPFDNKRAPRPAQRPQRGHRPHGKPATAQPRHAHAGPKQHGSRDGVRSNNKQGGRRDSRA